MSDCTQLSDLMPAAARGVVRWSAADEAHLATCRECAAEWELVRRTGDLGKSLEFPDPDALASAVLARLRVPAPAPRRRVLRWIIPVAVAASLVLVLVRPGLESPEDPARVAFTLLPEAETLTEAELESVIRLIPAVEPVDLRGVDSLTDEEFNEMLKDMEG